MRQPSGKRGGGKIRAIFQGNSRGGCASRARVELSSRGEFLMRQVEKVINRSIRFVEEPV